jgi:ribonuclease P protein component
MLLLKNRLRKKQEFENVYKKGKSFSFENINVRFVKNNLGHSRIGLVVSGKFSKKAVERNKIKRQLRTILRKNILLLTPGVDAVLIPKKGKKISYQILRENVEKTLQKAKIIS